MREAKRLGALGAVLLRTPLASFIAGPKVRPFGLKLRVEARNPYEASDLEPRLSARKAQ